MEKVEVNSERWMNPESLEGEIWRLIFVDEGGASYHVSNLGRVKKMLASGKEKILRQFKNWRGYWRVHASFLQPFVHRLVAIAFVRKPDSSCDDVDHRNAIKTDNRASNLHWVTRSGNMLNPITHWERNKAKWWYVGDKPEATITTDFISDEECAEEMRKYIESKRHLETKDDPKKKTKRIKKKTTRGQKFQQLSLF